MRKQLEYPLWVCMDCGRKYGQRQQRGYAQAVNDYATWHEDICGVCGQVAVVTEPRDYGHLRDGWQEHGTGGK